MVFGEEAQRNLSLFFPISAGWLAHKLTILQKFFAPLLLLALVIAVKAISLGLAAVTGGLWVRSCERRAACCMWGRELLAGPDSYGDSRPPDASSPEAATLARSTWELRSQDVKPPIRAPGRIRSNANNPGAEWFSYVYIVKRY